MHKIATSNVNTDLQYSKIYMKNGNVKTMATRSYENKCAMNCSITSKTGTTRTTTRSSPSTTPMTTLTHCTCTSTDAWRTCTEPARALCTFFDDDYTAHLMAQVLSAFHLHPWSSTWRTLLDSTSPLSSSSSSSCLSPSSFSTSSCSLSSTARRIWQTCAAPRRTRGRHF